MDIPVFIEKKTVGELKINQLIRQLKQRKLSDEDVIELKKDIDAIKRLKERHLIRPSVANEGEKRIYRRYCNIVRNIGSRIRAS